LIERIIIGLFQWGLTKLGTAGLKLFKTYLKNKRINDEVNSEVGQARVALKEIEEADRAGLVDGRLPKNEEDKLRVASRRLRRNLLG